MLHDHLKWKNLCGSILTVPVCRLFLARQPMHTHMKSEGPPTA